MLCHARKDGQRILIGDDIIVTVIGIKPGEKGGRAEVKLGVEAPERVKVHREEVAERIARETGVGARRTECRAT